MITPSCCSSPPQTLSSTSVHSMKTTRIDVRHVHNTKNSNIRKSMIRSEEGKFFRCIVQSLIQDSGALQYHDLEISQCGLCELNILEIKPMSLILTFSRLEFKPKTKIGIVNFLDVADKTTCVIHTSPRLIFSGKYETFLSLEYLLNILNISLSFIIAHLTLKR